MVTRDTNIDNVGEAAEWLEKGTKGEREEEEEFGEAPQMVLQESKTSVREAMQRKADQILNGTYKQPRNPTSQDLLNKARRLR